MWLDLIGIVFLGVFMLTGLLRGTLMSLVRIVTIVLAYAAAMWAAPRFGAELGQRLSLPGPIGMSLMGTLAFVGAYVACSGATFFIRNWERRRLEGEGRSPLDHIGGAVFGAVQGGIIVILLGWLGLWVEAGQATGSLGGLPSTENSALTKISQKVVETGAETLIDESEPAGRFTINMVSRPKQTVEGVQEVMSNDRMQDLQNDQLFWSYVETGAVEAALNQGSFLGLIHDESLRRDLAGLGVIPGDAAEDPGKFKTEARKALSQIGPRINELKTSQTMQSLENDPAIIAMVEAGDYAGLLADPRVRKLLSQVTAASSQPPASTL